MPLGIEGLLLFVLVIFPGVVARAEAQRVAAIPEDRIARTWVRELADALSYSLFLAPAAAVVGLLTLNLGTDGRLGLIDVVRLGPSAIAQHEPGLAVGATLAYAFTAFVLAQWVGASRAATKVRARIIDALKLGEGLSDEPIWWSIFEQGPRELQKARGFKAVEVFINAHIAGGGRYTGVLHYFAVAADTESCRDLAIKKARYYAPDSETALELEPDDVVLLNSRDCIAIEVKYLDKDRVEITGRIASDQPAASSSASGATVPPIGPPRSEPIS